MKRVVNTIQTLILFVVIFIASQILASILIGTLHTSGDVGFMLSYILSMGLVYLLTTLYERAEFGKVRLIRKSAKGFDPMAVFVGVMLLFAISITLWPLEDLMPGDGRVFGDGVYTLVTVVVISPIIEVHGPIKQLSPICAASFRPLVAPMVTHWCIRQFLPILADG